MDKNTTSSKFVNGFSSWQETHYEMVQAITIEHIKDEPTGLVKERHAAKGHAGLYELAEELTNKFEKLHEGNDYSSDDYFDEIEEFVKLKLNPIN